MANDTVFKRLVVEMDEKLHVEVKLRATKRGISIKKYVIRAIVEAIKKEQSYE